MALKFCTNFEFFTTMPGVFTSQISSTISSSLLSMQSNGSQVLANNGVTAQPTFTINQRINFTQFQPGNFGYSAQGNSLIGILVDNGTTTSRSQCGLTIASDGKLRFIRCDGAVGNPIGSSSSIALQADSGVTFYDIEWKITINGTTGSIECRVNGGVEIGPTGSLDTQSTSNAFADGLLIGSQFSGIPFFNLDHIIIMDGTGSDNNTFIGPVDVVLLPPTGDGTYTEWDFTGAPTRWQAVDDANPDSDTSYIFDDTIGQRNTFTKPNLPAGVTDVKAVSVWAYARRDDSTTRGFQVLLRNGADDELGPPEHFVGPDYQYFFTPFGVSPFSAAAWTPSEVNGTQYGVQITT